MTDVFQVSNIVAIPVRVATLPTTVRGPILSRFFRRKYPKGVTKTGVESVIRVTMATGEYHIAATMQAWAKIVRTPLIAYK